MSLELARNRVRSLWQEGDLFHIASRYPSRGDVPKVDRLRMVLERGLLAPAESDEVQSDLRLTLTGLNVPYDSLVFFHRFNPNISGLYLLRMEESFAVILDTALPVLEQSEMPEPWIVLCEDEVYVEKAVPAEKIVGLAITHASVEQIIAEFEQLLAENGIPLYDFSGKLLWPH